MQERHDRDNFGIMSRLYVSMTGITVPNRLHSTEIMKSDAFCSQPCAGPGNCGKSFSLPRFLCKNYDNDAYYFVFHFDIWNEYIKMKCYEHDGKYKVVK